MNETLPGCNTATYLWPTRGLAMDMAIQAILEMPETHLSPIQINQCKHFWLAGTEFNPEMFQIFYHVTEQGTGWVFDAIP